MGGDPRAALAMAYLGGYRRDGFDSNLHKTAFRYYERADREGCLPGQFAYAFDLYSWPHQYPNLEDPKRVGWERIRRLAEEGYFPAINYVYDTWKNSTDSERAAIAIKMRDALLRKGHPEMLYERGCTLLHCGRAASEIGLQMLADAYGRGYSGIREIQHFVKERLKQRNRNPEAERRLQDLLFDAETEYLEYAANRRAALRSGN